MGYCRKVVGKLAIVFLVAVAAVLGLLLRLVMLFCVAVLEIVFFAGIVWLTIAALAGLFFGAGIIPFLYVLALLVPVFLVRSIFSRADRDVLFQEG